MGCEPVKRLVTQTKLASLAGVTRQAVKKAMALSLKPALVGKKINQDHPAAIAYIHKPAGEMFKTPPPTGETFLNVGPPKPKTRKKAPKVEEPEPPAPPPPRPPRLPGEKPDHTWEEDEVVEYYGDMTLRDVVNLFGTGEQLKDWTVAVKNLEGIRQSRIKNAQLEGTVILRDLVENHVLGLVDDANNKLLQDSPKTIYKKVKAHILAEGLDAEGEEIVRKNISSQIKSIKARAQRALKNA